MNQLAFGDVDVWYTNLEVSHVTISVLSKLLDGREMSRATRFHFEDHRRRFIVARAFLRTILGRYLSVRPQNLTFGAGPQGKPYLDSHSQLYFNLSHSEGMVVCAVARMPVGIDLEKVRKDIPLLEIAAYAFSDVEFSTWREVGPGRREEAFFALWTRKEALLKADGRGLLIPMAKFSVSSELLVSSQGQASESCPFLDVERWILTDLTAPSGFVGTLASERTIHLGRLNEVFLESNEWLVYA